MQVHRVERDHGQDPCEDRRDLKFRVKNTGHDTGQKTAESAGCNGKPWRSAGCDHGCCDSTAQREAAFAGHIRYIQYAEGKKYADGQDRPHEPLGNGGKC
ncbi:Uncharacterised protein [Bacteroides xylanisolvens]|nr:Uncharacterised protein [Bacteroides xylanisolvens]